VELQKMVESQSQQIAQLTQSLTLLLAKMSHDGVANPTEKCYNIGTQNSKGGTQKGQIATSFNQSNEEELKFMQTQKNVRKRKDGRFEWQKMIGGVWHREIDKCYKILKRKIAEHEREIKIALRDFRYRKPKQKHILYELCKSHIEANKSQTKSFYAYQRIVELHLSGLKKSIDEYARNEIITFWNNITGSRIECFQILKSVFAQATEEGKLDRNIISTWKRPKQVSTKGQWFSLEKQKLIQEKKEKSGMADEIDFYLMVGCRAS